MKKSLLFRFVALVTAMMCALGAAAVEAYANYTPSNSTLTFYYDNLRSTRPGTTYDLNDYGDWPDWLFDNIYVTKVVFNSSFANARPESTNGWFEGMSELESITGMQYLNTSEVIDMANMFFECESLTSIDVSNFNTSKVTDMASMFGDCSSLTSLDLSNFNTSKVTDMGAMFAECSSLTSLDVSSFNTANVTDMNGMFNYCIRLTSLNLSNFNTAKVTKMDLMFAGCNLTSLDLSSFNTANVTDMNGMFASCYGLRTIFVGSSWSTASVTQSENMFKNCINLVGGQGTTFNENHVDKAYAHIDGGTSNPGYFTAEGAEPWAELEAYACYTSSNTTLTFYYDKLRSTRTGTTYDMNTGSYGPAWYTDGTNANVTRVVFNSSFADARPTTTYCWFSDMKLLQSITGINYLNTDQVTTMSYMFDFCTQLTSLDLSSFNTANVTNMTNMFAACISLTSLDVSNFNTSNVTNMFGMFMSCQNLTSLDLSSFNTAKVTDMESMFSYCYNLRTIYVGSAWSTAGVPLSDVMFLQSSMLVGGRGTTYDANHVDASYAHIDGGTSNPGYFTASPNEAEAYACYTPSNTTLTFYYDKLRSTRPGTTYDLNTGTNYPEWENDGSNANVTTVVFDPTFADVRPTTTATWFYGMQNLQTITGISNLKTSEVTNMYGMFYNCSKLTSLNLSSFNTAKVTNMSNMFYNCSQLTSLNVSSFNTAKVTNMAGMFRSCSSLTSLNVSNFNTANVLNMSYMFYGCSGLTNLNLSNFNTAKVLSMSYMFYNCNGLSSLSVSNFSTASVTTMQSMFANCRALTSLNVSSFNTANVTTMSSMFYYCNNLRSLDLSSFNTAKVTTMQSMFENCSTLTVLDLSSFNTAKVTYLPYMFGSCSALTTILVGNGWNMSAVTTSDQMFALCTSIVGGLGTTYNSNHIDKEYARIDGGSSAPGYLTDKGAPYSVLSNDGKTLTFYADGKRLQHTEQTFSMNYNYQDPDWEPYAHGVRTVVFDASMATARPTTTFAWFANMDQLTTITHLEYLNTSEVTIMNLMFYYCESLTSLDLSTFNTSKVTEMEMMFYECTSLTNLNLTSFNTSNVTIMIQMFYGCSSLVTLNLNSFNTSKVRYISEMFANCTSLVTVSVGDGWDLTHANSSDYMFYHCYSIMGELGTVYTEYPESVGEDAAHVDLPDYPGYFVSANYLTCPYALLTADGKKLTLYHDGLRGSRRTSKTYSIDWADNDEPDWYVDESVLEITQVVIHSSFADVRPTSTYYWFGQMTQLTAITGMQYLNTSEVTDMSFMFEDCMALTSLDVSHFDTKKVTYMRAMFNGCSELTSLDVSNFDTRNVTDMAMMFSYCNNLTTHNVSNFNTAKVTDMSGMFTNCQRLTSIDLSNFNTAKVTDMSGMFYCCKALTTLNLSNFNTANVTDMNWMFHTCTNLRTISVGDGWSTAKVTQSGLMFKDCTKLVGGAGTTYDANHIDKAYAHIDGGTSNPGYFTAAGQTGGMRGDVNNDGSVDISDATTLINYLLSGNTSGLNLENANCDQQGGVDISDATTLINYLLNGNW